MYICKKCVICDFVILILRVYWIIFCIMRIMYFYLIILTELLFCGYVNEELMDSFCKNY